MRDPDRTIDSGSPESKASDLETSDGVDLNARSTERNSDNQPQYDVPTGIFSESSSSVSDGLCLTVDADATQPNAGITKSSQRDAQKHELVPSGQLIGDYEIESVLGRGGMGVVYKAKHKTLGRPVALKMILQSVHAGSAAISRFIGEARAIAALQHPGIVQIFEIGEHDGMPYFCLELVPGKDLGQTLKDGQPWSAKPAADLVAKICDAMQYAHSHQVLHRDIKPANVLLDEQLNPKITDFGLAKKLDTGDQETKDGTVMGTPSYMPPEQARGDLSSIDNRSDVYSVGAVLYQLLTGRAPFVSDSMMETLVQVVQREPVQPRELQPGIPVDLETICNKAMQKERNSRYSTCFEFAQDLRRFLNGEPILARPISRTERLVRWCKRNPRVAVPSSLAMLFILTTTFVSLWAWKTTAAQAIVIADERDEAKTQRAIAETKKAEAEKQSIIANEQRKLAEENSELAAKQAQLALNSIQFIVTDVDTQLSQRPGTSEIRLAVMEAVSKKWDELDVGLVGGVRGEAIPTLMGVRQRLANAFLQLDRVGEAVDELNKLEQRARERIVLKEGTDASRLNLAKLLLASAPLQRRINNPAGVATQLSECIRLFNEVLDKPNPDGKPTDTLAVKQLIAIATQNLGVDYMRQGKLLETRAAFEQSLGSNREVLSLLESNSTPTDVQKHQLQIRELKISIDKAVLGLAYILMRLDKKDEALKQYAEAVNSRRRAFEESPDELSLKTALANQLALFGRALLWMRLLDQAEPVLREAVKLSDEVYKSDPEKADLKRDAAFAYYNAGVLRDLQGKKDLALGLIERSRLLRNELYDKSADDKNRYLLMQSEARAGNIETTKQLNDILAKKSGADAEIHFERSCALSQASVQNALDSAAKSQLINESIEALEKAVELGYEDPFRVANEPDFIPLQDQPRYRAVIEKLQTAANQKNNANGQR